MDLIKGLNNEQKEAVLSQNQHIRVIAGAGSGKTRVLTTRIVYLMQEFGVKPWRICAITFTNKAAREMKERMENMDPEAQRVHTSTIHALCVKILREEHAALGYGQNFTILDSTDQQQILKEAYKEFNYDRKSLSYYDALAYISNNKTGNISVENARILAGSDYEQLMRVNIYEFYHKRLKRMQALDFDDLLIEVHKILGSIPSIREKWQARFHVILVDEFQDVDHIQYGIIKNLAGEENQLYVVGDPDQTIYTWRGANVDYIIDFKKEYPNSETITLNQNYRSSQHILDVANTLIEYNSNRPSKELFANKESDIPVEYKEMDEAQDEAQWIARKIESLRSDTGSYLDTAVLYRSNYLSRSLEKTLMNRGIPYIIYGGLRFFDRQEIKDFTSYLRMITHGDDLALRRSVSIPRRGVGEKTLDGIAQEAEPLGFTLFEMMQVMKEEGRLKPKLREYITLIETWKTKQETMTLSELVEYVFRTSGLVEHYQKLEEEGRIANMQELIDDAKTFEKQQMDASLDAYMQMISLYGDREETIEGDYVRLMTVHAAKGLEFPHVIILGVQDNVFPNIRSVQEGKEGIEEERRLMYVAATRAKDVLILTSNRGYHYASGSYSTTSRFIREMKLNPTSSLDYAFESKPVFSEDAFVLNIKHKEKEVSVQKRVRYRKGEVVLHDEFGEGFVMGFDDETIRIAFNFPYGVKTLSKNYQGLIKKEDVS